MRYAVFTTTPNGLTLARNIKYGLDGKVEVFVKEGRPVDFEATFYEKLQPAVMTAFSQFDGLIFLSAAGIAVRMTAPYLKSKLTDPAVVVIDEQGKFAVSLLSGHVGGANTLTTKLAEIVGAIPVITTATDVNGKAAPDAIAPELGFVPYPKEHIQVINNGILVGKKIKWLVDASWGRADIILERLAERGIEVATAYKISLDEIRDLCVFITPKKIVVPPNVLCFVPRRLAVGVGCRRNTPESYILKAIKEALKSIGQDPGAVSVLASSIVKSDEWGILAAASDLGVEKKFFSNAMLQEKINAYKLPESEFVKKEIGVGNVCTASALCCFDRGSIALEKTKFEKVTVSLVWEK